ncbi:MAG: hypothetical protein WCX97_00250 [Candidatus Magasanikbacteria bacterium]
MWILVFQQLVVEALLDIIYFPLWWYTGGVARAGRFCLDLFKDGNDDLAPGLWMQNIFTPMYGQYDWQGRIISFFMRLFQVFFRLFGLLVWAVFCFGLFIVWLALPLVVLWGLLNSLAVKS